MQFLTKYSFLIFSLVIALSLAALFRLSLPFLAINSDIDGELLQANLTGGAHDIGITGGDVHDFSWNFSLSTKDNVLLPGELLIVDVAVDTLAPVAGGKLHIEYPNHLLDLVRLHSEDSIMHHERVKGLFSLEKTRNHGAYLTFENSVFNGANIGQGKFVRLYFVADDLGEGSVTINGDDSSLKSHVGAPGSVYSDFVSFRIK